MVVGSMTVETDVVIIGSGPGGYVAAIRAAQLGLDVLVVEREKALGGVCLNHGCIPTKALIEASSYAERIEEAQTFGVNITEHSIDAAVMFSWKQGIVDKLGAGIRGLFDKHGIEVIEGVGVFESENLLHVKGKSDVNAIRFKHAIIATGSTPIELPFARFDSQRILSSRDALRLGSIPESLTIIGGGYIGTEMATVFAKLGTRVTIIEGTERLVPSVEKQLVGPVTKKLEALGVTVHVNAKATKVETRDAVTVTFTADAEQTVSSEKLLVVVGRKPTSKGIGLEAAGVDVDEHGFITTDEMMRTSVPHIYAIGDVQGQPMLAHKAMRQAKVAAESIAGHPSAYDNKVVPAVVFNDPEMMSVGYTEEEAKAKGYDVKSVHFPYAALAKAIIHGKGGFIEIVADTDTGIVRGIHAVGPHVSELAGEAALAIELGASVEDLALTIHPHPTVSEGLVEAADVFLGSSAHIFQKGS
ncbi:MAG: dihydrolipoyl dehydrogenase [Candidatus Woesearchaeota archaeon]